MFWKGCAKKRSKKTNIVTFFGTLPVVGEGSEYHESFLKKQTIPSSGERFLCDEHYGLHFPTNGLVVRENHKNFYTGCLHRYDFEKTMI